MPRILEAKLLAEGKKFALIMSRFNDFITEKLVSGEIQITDGQLTGLQIKIRFKIVNVNPHRCRHLTADPTPV